MHAPKHIHILGICGTFMGSLALLARELGYKVTGSDQNVYPPMSTQLESQGIELSVGYELDFSNNNEPDLFIIGNVMKRGNPAVEYVLNRGLPYVSGPEFFSRYIAPGRWVLGVAGTHGKTTTTSMLAKVLQHAGMEPGFLIGGIPKDFGLSARLGSTPFFVIEADEYDTAFFDKRSKFVHYHPRTLVINNLEFDHADIFSSIADIQAQFHNVIRTVPGNGQVIYPANVASIDATIEMGCWSEQITLQGSNSPWQARALHPSHNHFEVLHHGTVVGEVKWAHEGEHNLLNALAAIAAAHHVGVKPQLACEALFEFQGVKRRMELVAEVAGVRIYDDFAHHPTAIATTINGQRALLGEQGKLKVVIEPRSNTMKMGIHQQNLIDATAAASEVIWFEGEGMTWSLKDLDHSRGPQSQVMTSVQAIVDYLVQTAEAGDHIVIMSNGGFEGIHGRLATALAQR